MVETTASLLHYLWSMPALRPVLIALSATIVTEGLRLVGYATGRRLPGADSIDTLLGWAMRSRQEPECGALQDLALIALGLACCEDMLSLFWGHFMVVQTLLCWKTLRDNVLSMAFNDRITYPRASERIDILAYRYEHSYGHAVADALSTMLWMLFTLMWCCGSMIIAMVRTMVCSLMVLSASHLAINSVLGEVDGDTGSVAIWASGLLYGRLRRWEAPRGFWNCQLRHGMRLLVSVTASVAVAASVSKLATLPSEWMYRIKIHKAMQLLHITLPLLSPKALSVVSAQVRRAADRGWRRLTARPVVPRPPEISEVCAICHDDLCHDNLSSGKAAVLAHCKWGCGRAVHRKCMESWQQHSAASAKCVFCGAGWF